MTALPETFRCAPLACTLTRSSCAAKSAARMSARLVEFEGDVPTEDVASVLGDLAGGIAAPSLDPATFNERMRASNAKVKAKLREGYEALLTEGESGEPATSAPDFEGASETLDGAAPGPKVATDKPWRLDFSDARLFEKSETVVVNTTGAPITIDLPPSMGRRSIRFEPPSPQAVVEDAKKGESEPARSPSGRRALTSTEAVALRGIIDSFGYDASFVGSVPGGDVFVVRGPRS